MCRARRVSNGTRSEALKLGGLEERPRGAETQPWEGGLYPSDARKCVNSCQVGSAVASTLSAEPNVDQGLLTQRMQTHEGFTL